MKETCQNSSIEALLAPRSIAVFGASNSKQPLRRGGPGTQILRNLLRDQGSINVYPVHPTADELGGRKAYSTIAEVPDTVDMAVIALSADRVVATVKECISAKVRAATIISAGFAETEGEGRQRQMELGELSAASDIRILGPNCVGYFNLTANVSATFAFDARRLTRRDGTTAIISQSGGLCSYLGEKALARGIHFSWLVSTGNELHTDVSTVAAYLVEQAEIQTILVFCEGIQQPDVLLAAAGRARELGKSIVLLSAGQSDGASRAVASHTAAMASSMAVTKEVCRQHGILVARTIDELLDFGLFLQSGRCAAGNRVGILTASGGVGILLADAVEKAGLHVPVLPDETRTTIEERMPKPFYGTTENPVDVTAQVTAVPSAYTFTLDRLVNCEEIDSVLTVIWAYPGMSFEWLTSVYRSTKKPMAVVSNMAVPELSDAGIPIFFDPHRAGAALAATVHRNIRDLAPERGSVAFGGAELSVRILSESSAKSILRRYNIPICDERLVADRNQARFAAREIGYPVGMKVISHKIPHKSEFGAVKLWLSDDNAVDRTYDELVHKLSAQIGAPEIEGILIQEMISGDLELVCGMHRDPTFGVMVTVGLGGYAAEIVGEFRMLRSPFTREDAYRVLAYLAEGRLVTGARAIAEQRRHDLAEIMVSLAAIGREQPHIREIDLNPLIVGTSRVTAVDALITV